MLTIDIFAEYAQDSAHGLHNQYMSAYGFMTTYCGVKKGHGCVKDVVHGLVMQVLRHIK